MPLVLHLSSSAGCLVVVLQGKIQRFGHHSIETSGVYRQGLIRRFFSSSHSPAHGVLLYDVDNTKLTVLLVHISGLLAMVAGVLVAL